MPKQAMENLTESMFYLLMALQQGDACGAEISARAAQISGGAVRLGPPPSTPCWPALKRKACWPMPAP